jgi:hypothetical protein
MDLVKYGELQGLKTMVAKSYHHWLAVDMLSHAKTEMDVVKNSLLMMIRHIAP